MPDYKDIILAVKCAPQEDIFADAEKAGLEAIELYLSKEILTDLKKTITTCRRFPFSYTVHAPSDGSRPYSLVELVKEIDARIVVFHNIYWEDEWEGIIKNFKGTETKLCVENTYSVHEPLKFIHRHGLGRCLDLEHLQMECAGVFEEEFIPVIKQALHIHLTGYTFGSNLWHTHIHQSPRHNLYMLDLLKKAGYSGFVVSEAKISLQTYREFKKLNSFYKMWQIRKTTE